MQNATAVGASFRMHGLGNGARIEAERGGASLLERRVRDETNDAGKAAEEDAAGERKGVRKGS